MKCRCMMEVVLTYNWWMVVYSILNLLFVLIPLRLKAVLGEIEQEHGVTQRWNPGDEPFRLARDEANDRQKQACYHKFHSKVTALVFVEFKS